MAKLENPLTKLPKVNQTMMAEFLGVSSPTLARWCKLGWVDRNGANFYEPQETVQRLAKRVARIVTAAELEEAGDNAEEADPRIRKWRIEADLKQIELDRATGAVIEVDDVAMVLSTVISGAKQVLLALNTTILAQYPDLPVEAQTIVRDAVHFALTELADTDVAKTLAAADADLADMDSPAEYPADDMG